MNIKIGISLVLIVLFLVGVVGSAKLGIPSIGGVFYLIPTLLLVSLYTAKRKYKDKVIDLLETFLLILGIDIFARYILIPIQAWNTLVSYLVMGASFIFIQKIVSSYLPWTSKTSPKIGISVQITTWIVIALAANMYLNPFLTSLSNIVVNQGKGVSLSINYLNYSLTLILSYIISSRLIENIHSFIEEPLKLKIIIATAFIFFSLLTLDGISIGYSLSRSASAALIITLFISIFGFISGASLIPSRKVHLKKTEIIRKNPGRIIVKKTIKYK